MPFEADLKSHLQTDAAIVAMVGDRIHPAVLPAGSALPALTYQHIGGAVMTDLSGGDGSLRNPRVQINCWAATYVQAHALSEAVRARLKTAAGTFKAVPVLGPQDAYEQNTKRHGVYYDYSFMVRSS